MTRQEARKQLAENLMMLAEALLDDESSGQYQNGLDKGQLKITSVVGNSTTVIAIKKWTNDEEEDDWADIIE